MMLNVHALKDSHEWLWFLSKINAYKCDNKLSIREVRNLRGVSMGNAGQEYTSLC